MDTMIRHRAAVLGHPIAHSLSPALHGAAYQALGLPDWAYGRVDVRDDQLADFLAACDEDWAGLSLTMPLKRAVLSLGEPCDKWSAALGIANTLVFDRSSGRPPLYRLYNTDVFGVKQAVGGQAFDDVLIIGSGSTAVSAAAAVSELGAGSVHIATRNMDQAPVMQALLSQAGIPVSRGGLDVEELAAYLDEHGQAALLVVSALPPHACDGIATWLAGSGTGRWQVFSQRPFLLDVAYDPSPTRLVDAWSSLGGQAVDGRQMLLWQAVEQVHLMTGQTVGPAVLQAMREAVNVR